MATYLGSVPIGTVVVVENPTTDLEIWRTMDMTNTNLNGGVVPTDEEYEKAYEVYKSLATLILGGI